jgi:hypothetical protein
VIVQTPLPPIPPEFPGIMTGGDVARIVLVSVAGAAVLLWILVRGPIGIAIGEVIKRLFGGHRQHDVGQLDDVHARLDAMQRQIGELAERQDFAERLLAQARRDKALPGGSDVAG